MTIQEIRDNKKLLGYSNKELARRAGLPVGTVQKVLSGETQSPRHRTLLALSEALNKGLREMNGQFNGSQVSSPRSAAYCIESDEDSYNTYPDFACEDNLAYAYGSGAGSEDIPDVILDARTRSWRRQGTYTVGDYELIPDDVRVELIDGVIYDMGAPTIIHQIIAGAVHARMLNYHMTKAADHDCMPLIAPYDVQLDCDEFTMVQPDVLVICGVSTKDIIKRLKGAPDFVMEVLSPSTRKKDVNIKRRKYYAAGVREYWIVDPESVTVNCYDFRDTSQLLFPVLYTFDDTVPVLITDGELEIDFTEIRDMLRRIGIY